jgi:hypothetical protein
VADLSLLALLDLEVLWDDVRSPVAAKAALLAVMPAVVDEYGAASAAFAADWYDDTRSEVGARGRFRAVPATWEAAEDFALWAAQPLFRADLEFPDAVAQTRHRINGGLQRRIGHASRDTVAGSAVRDPAARGWQRGGAGKCKSGFCDMLIARGAVYTEATAAFAAHDWCKCYAIPAWGGQPVPVKSYTPNLNHVSDADRARLREYLRENGYV